MIKKDLIKKMLTISFVFLLFTSTNVFALKINHQVSSDHNFKELSKTEWYVPDDFPSIQEAIENATNGDIINVRERVYYENVVIYKEISLIGENKHTTIINGQNRTTTVLIAADNVEVSGFTLIGGRNNLYASGIHVVAENAMIFDNIATSNKYGIFIGVSGLYIYSNHIKNNTIFSNDFHGIRLGGSHDCTITGNTIYGNNKDGLELYECSNNKVEFNAISNNVMFGILLQHKCNNNIIKNNSVILNGYDPEDEILGWGGIAIWGGNSNSITGNYVKSNFWIGITISGTEGTLVSNNEIIENEGGLWLRTSSLCNIIRNNITDSFTEGIIVYEYSNLNQIYHNNFINNSNKPIDMCTNKWDNGKSSGGNYWDDYQGEDKDGDGLGDTPYYISGGINFDKYPLMKPFSGKKVKNISNYIGNYQLFINFIFFGKHLRFFDHI